MKAKVVIDANILITALMGSWKTFEIIDSGECIFYSPSTIIKEVQKHLGHVCKKTQRRPDEMYGRFCSLLKCIEVIQNNAYYAFLEIAKEHMARDVSDAEYLACALAVKADFIWTNDKDFTSQKLVPCKTTDQFIKRTKTFKYLDSLISSKKREK